MKRYSRKAAFSLCLILTITNILSGCSLPQSLLGSKGGDAEETEEAAVSVSYNQDADASKGERNYTLEIPEWKDSYAYADPEEEKVCRIEFQQDSVTITEKGSYAKNVSIEGTKVSISGKGYYEISGASEDGQVYVNAGDEKVHLYLNGVSLQKEEEPAILVEDADKVYIGLVPGTENVITSSVFKQETVENAEAEKENVTPEQFSDSGNENAAPEKPSGGQDAEGGDFDPASEAVKESASEMAAEEINAATDEEEDEDDGTADILTKADAAIYARADLILNGTGTLAIENTAGGGIHTTKDLVFAEGTYEITSGQDAVKGKDSLSIFDGNYKIDAGGAGLKVTNKQEDGKGNLYIENGDFQIASTDDGLHSNMNTIVCGGQFTITTQDDGMHANEVLLVQDAKVDVTESYEGLEGTVVDLVRAEVSVVASDDGINAATGSGTSGGFGGGGGFGKMDMGDVSGNGFDFADGNMPEIPEDFDFTSIGLPEDFDINNIPEDFDFSSIELPEGFEPNGSMPGGDGQVSGNGFGGGEKPDGTGADFADGGKPDADGQTSENGGGEKPDGTGVDFADGDRTASGNGMEFADGDTSEKHEKDGEHNGRHDGSASENGGGDRKELPEGEAMNVSGNSEDMKGFGGFGFGGGPNSSSGTNCMIYLEDSDVTIDAGGDGVDSNGAIYMYSGTLKVEGPTSNGDTALDYETTFVVYGGTINSFGSNGMVEQLSEDSEVPIITVNLSQDYPAGSEVTVKTQGGETLRICQVSKRFSSIILAGDDFVDGETYTVYIGGEEVGSCTVDGILNQIGSSRGFHF